MDLSAQDTTTLRRIVELRRSFHEHPELAFEEVRTAEVITEELDRLFTGAQIDYTVIDTSKPLDYALFRYLSSREKMTRVR